MSKAPYRIITDMNFTVDDLISMPFRYRTYQERAQIVKNGRPRPILAKLMDKQEDNPEFAQEFWAAQYERFSWLTGCQKRESLFCWPCLLFISDKGAWNYSGFSQFVSPVSKLYKHEKSCHHLQATFDLYLFNKWINTLKPDDRFIEMSRDYHKLYLKRHKAILKKLTDVVLYVLHKNSPLGAEIDSWSALEDNCKELLNLMRIDSHNNQLSEAIVLVRDHNVLSKITKALCNLLKRATEDEIQKSTFVSMILTEVSRTATTCHVAVKARYLLESTIVERFLGIKPLHSYGRFHDRISKLISEYQISPEKLVGIACDGKIIAIKHAGDLSFKFHSKYPYAYVIPFFSQNLEIGLEQSICCIRECSMFLKVVNNLSSFLRNPKVRLAFDDFIKSRDLDLNVEDLVEVRSILKKVDRKQLIAFFENIVQNFEQWDDAELLKARGFCAFLGDIPIAFVWEMFSDLFSYTSEEKTSATGDHTGNSNEPKRLSQIEEFVTNYKTSNFTKLWNAVSEETDNSAETDTEESEQKRSKIKWKYYRLFHEILQQFLLQLDIRCQSVSKMEFFNILSFQSNETFCHSFFYDTLPNFLQLYSGLFIQSRLENELEVLSAYHVVHNKKVEELLTFLAEEGLHSDFKEIYKLCEIFLTLPFKRSSSRSDCPLEVPDNLSCVSSVQDFYILRVERDRLENMLKIDSFYENVIDDIYKQKTTIN